MYEASIDGKIQYMAQTTTQLNVGEKRRTNPDRAGCTTRIQWVENIEYINAFCLWAQAVCSISLSTIRRWNYFVCCFFFFPRCASIRRHFCLEGERYCRLHFIRLSLFFGTHFGKWCYWWNFVYAAARFILTHQSSQFYDWAYIYAHFWRSKSVD